MDYLDFEQPLADIDSQIEAALAELSDASAGRVPEHVAELRKTAQKPPPYHGLPLVGVR